MMRIIWGCLTTSVAVLAVTAVEAQTLVADEIREPYGQGEMMVGRGPYAAVPPPGAYGDYDAIPPFQAMRILRMSGYEPMSRPARRGPAYMIAAVSPDGQEGRVVIDARTGRITRFVPMDYGAGEREGYGYGPEGMLPPQNMNARTSLRPPATVPHVANRTPVPAPAPKQDAKLAPAAPAAVAPGTQPLPAKQAAVAPPKAPEAVAGKPPAPAKPAVELQPTQPLPPVQDFN